MPPGTPTTKCTASRWSDKPIGEIWAAYWAQRADELLGELMVRYRWLVSKLAAKVSNRTPWCVEFDDLESDGMLGLREAIIAFDPDRAVKFTTFAPQRIRGAIIDGIRAMDFAPRLVRSRSVKIGAAIETLTARLQRPPSHEELAERLGLSMHQLQLELPDATARQAVSLSTKWFETDSGRDVTEAHNLADPHDGWSETITSDAMRQMLRGLCRAEKMIVVLYYQEEMTMKQIGRAIGLSESRVSQMLSSILLRLKAQLDESGERR